MIEIFSASSWIFPSEYNYENHSFLSCKEEFISHTMFSYMKFCVYQIHKIFKITKFSKISEILEKHFLHRTVSGLAINTNSWITNYLLNIHCYSINSVCLFSVLWGRFLVGVRSKVMKCIFYNAFLLERFIKWIHEVLPIVNTAAAKAMSYTSCSTGLWCES